MDFRERRGNEAWGGMKTKSKPAAATASPSAPADRLKRINLAGIATNSAATKTAEVYPLLPDADGQVAALVEGILEKSEQLEAIEGALEIEKAVHRDRQAVLMYVSKKLINA